MKKSKICVSRRLIIITLLILFFFGFILFTTKLIKLTNSISSKAAIRRLTTPKTKAQRSLLQSGEKVISIDDIKSKCSITDYYPSYFNYLNNWNDRDNQYGLLGAYMVGWYVEIANKNIVYDRALIKEAKHVYSITNNLTCGLWEVGMRRLIDDYQNNINPKQALHEIRFLSAKTILNLSGDNYKYHYLNNQNTISTKDIIGYQFTNKAFNTALNKIYTTGANESVVYQIENSKLSLALYLRENYINNVSPPPLPTQIQGMKDKIDKQQMQIGIIYPTLPTGISAIAEPFIVEKIQLAIDKSCDDYLSNTLPLYCNLEISKITDPTYISQIIIEKKFGRNSINQNFINYTKQSLQTFQSLSSFVGMINAIRVTGETIPLGYDFTKANSRDQTIALQNFLNQSTGYSRKEMEVGWGGIYTVCPPDTICIKTDFDNIPLESYKLPSDYNKEIGISGFFTLNANTIQVNNLDLIYFIAPYPAEQAEYYQTIDYGSSLNIVETASILATKLRSDGMLIIIYDSDYNYFKSDKFLTTDQAFQEIKNRIGLNNGSFLTKTVTELQGDRQYRDLPVIKYLDSDYLDSDYSIIKVLIFTKK